MGLEYMWILLIVSAVLCAVGFYKYVYFLSIGYGFAVAGIGITLIIMSACSVFSVTAAHYIMCAVFIIYGLRLSLFLLIREIKSSMYRKTLKEATGDEKSVPIFVKISIWVCVAILYVAQTSPVYFRMYNGAGTSTVFWLGIIICVIAIALESLADKQKNDQKKVRPDMVATKGLYTIVRCPNYFAEILFWTGVFVSGLDIYTGIGQWLTAAIAYICIVYIMFNGAQRLEKRQMKKYKNNSEYHSYVEKTPIIIPLLPIYHLNREEKANE